MKSLLRRDLWSAFLVFAVFGAIAPQLAHARVHHSDSWARERFAAAERMREALNGRPPADRTRRDYQRVLNAYRLVYHGAPTSTKADPSVVAVAETLVEMGSRFEDDKILHEAIEQYRFLRREYPGSRYRYQALFTIGEIYLDDLNDREAGRAAFQEFLRHYPHNHLADDARQAIAALAQPGVTPSDSRKAAEQKSPEKNQNDKEAAAENHDSGGESAKDEDSEKNELSPNEQSPNREESAKADQPAKNESTHVGAGHLPRVTGIRHWSTPDYTRVAIDVEGDVKFSSERISHPARIYFDLRDTRLASTLVGKSFDVDDGFLKKVRVAQFAPRRTRIVLEVDNLSDYDAFLLPNPSRLIIDIHGKDINGRDIHGKDFHSKDAHVKVPGEHGAAEAESTAAAKTSDKGGEIDAAGPSSGSAAETDVAENRLPSNQELSDTAEPEPAASAISGSQQNGIVKRVVEADDDDGAAETASAPSVKRNPRLLQPGASKKGESDDLESDPVPDSDLSTTSRGNVHSSKPKPDSRKLASSDRGSSDFAIHEAKPTETGDRSLIRALGLKIGKIVIDPGHGGHDTGTIGPNGLEEKDLVLDVGRRLGKLLEARLGAEVVYTRKDDTFIPLETRTAIANQARADLFVSIHANSSHDPDARGVETYYLNFTSSRDALEVAARENAVSDTSIYELQDLVKKIALKEKIEESREFAWDVQESLHSGLAAKSPAIRDRGVKKAPFIVLIGANMPSILAEISFVSNPTDERRLSTAEYRQRIAESLYRGIAKYANGLSGVKVASKIERDSRQ
ncbi:MAG: N-acetylmuramoyl-L-alanine amidase [Candidatus Sulfotelmatobacter sp.]